MILYSTDTATCIKMENGTIWTIPNIKNDNGDADWRLRNTDWHPIGDERRQLAAILSTFKYLIDMPQKKRNKVITEIRENIKEFELPEVTE